MTPMIATTISSSMSVNPAELRTFTITFHPDVGISLRAVCATLPQVVLFYIVAEGSKTHPEQLRCFDLHTTRALERFCDIAPFNLFDVRFEIKAGGRERFRGGRGGT